MRDVPHSCACLVYSEGRLAHLGSPWGRSVHHGPKCAGAAHAGREAPTVPRDASYTDYVAHFKRHCETQTGESQGQLTSVRPEFGQSGGIARCGCKCSKSSAKCSALQAGRPLLGELGQCGRTRCVLTEFPAIWAEFGMLAVCVQLCAPLLQEIGRMVGGDRPEVQRGRPEIDADSGGPPASHVGMRKSISRTGLGSAKRPRLVQLRALSSHFGTI